MCFFLYDFFIYVNSGFTEEDFEKVAIFFDRAVTIAQDLKTKTGPKLKDFKAAVEHGVDGHAELVQLKQEVTEFSRKFPTIGF